jgi:hypothetical protein
MADGFYNYVRQTKLDANNMNLQTALETLDIADYGERIFRSNSHGELFHLMDYAMLADVFSPTGEKVSSFRPWFQATVKFAEENWSRPESIFQHIPKMLDFTFKAKEQQDNAK